MKARESMLGLLFSNILLCPSFFFVLTKLCIFSLNTHKHIFPCTAPLSPCLSPSFTTTTAAPSFLFPLLLLLLLLLSVQGLVSLNMLLDDRPQGLIGEEMRVQGFCCLGGGQGLSLRGTRSNPLLHRLAIIGEAIRTKDLKGLCMYVCM